MDELEDGWQMVTDWGMCRCDKGWGENKGRGLECVHSATASESSCTSLTPTILQAIGWSFTLLLIVVAFLVRCLRPCFDQTVFLQRRYWSNYVDLEQKLFDETCCEHARDFAHRCVLHFFASMQSELRSLGLHRDPAGGIPESQKSPEPPGDPDGGIGKAHLRAISSRQQVDHLLSTWYSSKPPLDLTASPRLWGPGLNHRAPIAALGAKLCHRDDV